MSEEMIDHNLPDENASREETEREETFADLFQQSSSLAGRLEPGQKVKSTIVSITGDSVFIDLGGKSEGFVDLDEFRNDEGNYDLQIGDEIEVFFVSVQNGMKKLTTLSHGLSTIDLAGIQSAYEAGVPVSGRVSSELKGGYEVYVGKVRCFCPYSQIDLRGSREANAYVGQTFPFKILEYEEDGRNVILSRRVLLEEEKRTQVEKFKESLAVGMDVTAQVRAVHNFGAFVDLGGVEGLIPASEIGWSRTDKVGDMLSVGQEVTVRIIAIDWEKNRLTLSLKATLPDPWLNVADRIKPGTSIRGMIVRLAPFGAFVNIEPGIDGLIHISKLGAGRRISHPKDAVEVGQWVEAWVVEVDPVQKKISLSVEQERGSEPLELPMVGDVVQGAVERVVPAGVLLKTSEGVVGFIPNSEMGTPRGTNHNRLFPAGTIIQAIVKEIDAVRGRVTLSRLGVEERAERQEYGSYQDKVKSEDSATSLGSFGELLKASLEKRESRTKG
jgi:small subunit ribosomal protein S1